MIAIVSIRSISPKRARSAQTPKTFNKNFKSGEMGNQPRGSSSSSWCLRHWRCWLQNYHTKRSLKVREQSRYWLECLASFAESDSSSFPWKDVASLPRRAGLPYIHRDRDESEQGSRRRTRHLGGAFLAAAAGLE